MWDHIPRLVFWHRTFWEESLQLMNINYIIPANDIHHQTLQSSNGLRSVPTPSSPVGVVVGRPVYHHGNLKANVSWEFSSSGRQTVVVTMWWRRWWWSRMVEMMKTMMVIFLSSILSTFYFYFFYLRTACQLHWCNLISIPVDNSVWNLCTSLFFFCSSSPLPSSSSSSSSQTHVIIVVVIFCYYYYYYYYFYYHYYPFY